MSDMKINPIRIMIGSNGGLTGVYLAKELRKNSDYLLFGFDASQMTVGKFFVSNQFYLPTASNDGFVDKLIELLKKERIDVYLPVHSKEIKQIALNEEKIREQTNCSFIVSPYKTFELLDNKKDANINLEAAGIPVPKIITEIGCDYPIFMKREVGSGSSGAEIIQTQDLHKAYMESSQGVAFFELINGTEYTLDCLFSQDSQLLGYNQRKRIKTIGGAVSITQNDNSFDIDPWIKKLSKSFRFCGCVNFQYIVRDNIPYFIDVNLRYPSGGLPLTVSSGLNIPRLIVKMLCQEEIMKDELVVTSDHQTMYRYYEEIIVK